MPNTDHLRAVAALRFRALGDETRLRVLELLGAGEKSVADLIDATELGQSLAELKAQPFFNALTTKTDLDPRIARMAEIPPVFIDMTTDVTHPSPPAEMPKPEPEDRKTNFKQIELGSSEDEAVRGAEP